MSKPSQRPRGQRNKNLTARLSELVAGAPVQRPLPTTRMLGRHFGVSNTTIFRALQALIAAGEIWQMPGNGRYYPAAAQALLHRPQPVACLMRRLELGSELYRELLEGISTGCGVHRRTMLLWHDELLVNHPDPHEPPLFAKATQQRAILSDFIDRHSVSASGFLLDHVWADEALRQHADRLRPAVVLFRSCQLEGFANIAADFHGGALKALVHLLDRGYERIMPVHPFAGDPAVDEFFAALGKAVAELGCQARLAPGARASTRKERTALANRLRSEASRTALLCPEDNIAGLLVESLNESGVACPEKAGVLTVMGTDFATRAQLTCLRYDFRAMGRQAVEALEATEPLRRSLPPQLVHGRTT